MDGHELLVVIPAYNEEKTIARVLELLKREGVFEFADILVVDDGSLDATGQIAKDSRCLLVSHVFNLGYGSALQTGYKYALRNGYQYVIQMDADGQHDPCNIPVIYSSLREPDEAGRLPDMVLGSRFMEGSVDFPVSAAKKMAFLLFRFMIRLATGERIADPTTGLQGLNRRAFSCYAAYGRFDERYPDANMIMQMLLLHYRIRQIPAVMHARQDGQSMHAGLKPVWYMLRMFFCVLAVVFRIRVLRLDKEVQA
ncbi:MAG: glycosyltransferase family 2 protein [Provencibacterium sp.]|jgi:glycosyltransferase involved in cell wall biosynthesis|nr:glycosyltransferase family 2 protein [Provencibacterium sp.]